MVTVNLKSNRFYFFVVGYAALFAMLAFFGTEEAARLRGERTNIIKEAESRLDALTKHKVIFNLPRMDVTMTALEGETHRMRLGISLEIDKKSVETFEGYQPRVSDRIVNFLNHQDINEFTGSNGMDKLRNDILFEANKASGPVVINDVIFSEFIVR